MRITKDRILELWKAFRIDYGRGDSLVSQIESIAKYVLFGGVTFVILFKDSKVPVWLVSLVGIGYVLFKVFLGWYDKRYLGLWAKENKSLMGDKDINPIFFEIKEKIDRIEKKLDNKFKNAN